MALAWSEFSIERLARAYQGAAMPPAVGRDPVDDLDGLSLQSAGRLMLSRNLGRARFDIFWRRGRQIGVVTCLPHAVAIGARLPPTVSRHLDSELGKIALPQLPPLTSFNAVEASNNGETILLQTAAFGRSTSCTSSMTARSLFRMW
jgi:hypothetical protein